MKEVAGALGPAQIPLARLVGQGIMLSRQAGGVVLVDLGKSVELNRRSVHNQITDIERQLRQLKEPKPFVKNA